jgi:pyruvate/oxaloacetate carboxyltransferase
MDALQPFGRIENGEDLLIRVPVGTLVRDDQTGEVLQDVLLDGQRFVAAAHRRGVQVFRVFDALNDFRNFKTVLRMIKKYGRHFQGAICYSLTESHMGGDVYNLDYYLEKAKELQTRILSEK